jgi:predicted DsbA family dithiol-disulfide isomerase
MDVEIWSDIACPWCYVGKRRFEAALASFEHRDEVRVTWRSFELDPSAPAEREGDNAANLADKYGKTRDEALGMLAQMTRTAAADGLEFHFDRARGGNTFDAHRLTHLAAEHGKQDEMKERLMRAYLTEGELISDAGTLARLAAEVGLPADQVDALLSSQAFADDVRADEVTANQLGISAVPFFVIDRQLGAAGAQPPETLLGLLERGWELRPALAMVASENADGDSCGVDGC